MDCSVQKTNDEMTLLHVANLSCVRQQKNIFTQISFELKAGDILLIEGPNGSGKSSLLRLLAGLATPADGEIHWCGRSIQYRQSEYYTNLHYIGHTNGIKLGLTVAENLQLIQHLNLSHVPTNFESVLSLLQLAAYQHTPAKYLSAGQRRRLALAKLFLFPKIIWVLDEPLTALDINTQTIFLLHLEKHLKAGGIGLISSHHPIQLQSIEAQTLRLVSC